MSTINLLPEDYIQRRAQQRSNILCLGLFGVVMAGTIGAALVGEERAKAARDIREQVSREYEQASRLIAQLQELQAKRQEMIAKAQVAGELRERVPRSYLLATITNALPSGAGLKQLKLKTVVLKPAAPPPAANKFDASAQQRGLGAGPAAAPAPSKPPSQKVTIEVTGLAQTDVQVAQFINTMARDPLVDSADLVYSKETEFNKVKVREFQVTLELRADAEVEDPSKAPRLEGPTAGRDGEPAQLAEHAAPAGGGLRTLARQFFGAPAHTERTPR